jgi:tetratricopeptide (TPR) repeat protein
MMKRVLYISLTFLLIAVSNLTAQPLKKAEAVKHLQDGDLESARQAIDVAVLNDITSKEADTWYYRAYIYNEYFKEKDNENPFSQFRTAVANSCSECIKLDITDNKEWATECRKIYDLLAKRYYNDGVSRFQNESFRDSYKLFNLYLDIMDEINPDEIDANAIFLTGYSAFNNRDYGNAKKFLLRAKSRGLNTYQLYFYLAKTYWELNDKESAFATLVEGNEKHPTRKELVELHLKYLQEAGDITEKEHVLVKAIKLDPENVDYMILLAIQYETYAEKFVGEPNYDIYIDKAKEYYKRALEMKPDHLLANYNLGLLYYNRGVTMANELDPNADILTIFEVQDKVTKLFQEALPFMQKSFELNPKRKDTIIALDNIYTALNNPEKAKYYRELLKSL